ncbi:MAG: hypothetical protein PHU71_06785 [Candidatus Gracilibacteria bacterium]|nr:hypothetical protein [Candidatus Gracilibacteria bacterium]
MDKAKHMQNKVYLASMPYKPNSEQLQTIQKAIKSAENQKYAIIDKPLPRVNRAIWLDSMDKENQKISKINNRLTILRDMEIGKIPFDLKFINPFGKKTYGQSIFNVIE